MVSLVPLRIGHPLDREIVALRAAAGEDDFSRRRPQKGGDPLPRLFDGPFASWPKAWRLDGLPKRSEKYGNIAATTSGSQGVVAA